MNASTTAPLAERFLGLCAAHDERLRQAIVACRVDSYPDGMIVLLQVAPQQLGWLGRYMAAIVRFLGQLGRFKMIDVKTENKFFSLKLGDLVEHFPEACPHQQQVKTVDNAQGFAALINHITQGSHAFVIGTDGYYKQVHLRRASTDALKPDDMVDQPLDRFIGSAGAAYLLQELQAAYTAGLERAITYSCLHPNGESRLYAGTLIPVPGAETCILVTRQIKQPSHRSLVAPG